MLPASSVLSLHLPRTALYLNAHLIAFVFSYDALFVERVVVVRQPKLFHCAPNAPRFLFGHLSTACIVHKLPPFNEYCRRFRLIYTHFPKISGGVLGFFAFFGIRQSLSFTKSRISRPLPSLSLNARSTQYFKSSNLFSSTWRVLYSA